MRYRQCFNKHRFKTEEIGEAEVARFRQALGLLDQITAMADEQRAMLKPPPRRRA